MGSLIEWITGLSVALIATFLASLGMTLQRKSHLENQLEEQLLRQPLLNNEINNNNNDNDNDNDDDETESISRIDIHSNNFRNFYQCCSFSKDWYPKFKIFFSKHLWGIGFSIYLVSSLTGSIFSIGSLPVTLLAPIGAFNLLCNTLLAILLLGDKLSFLSSLGTLIILIGAIMVGLFGMIPESERSLEDLMILYQRLQFIIYFSIQEVFIILMLILNHFWERKLKKFIEFNLKFTTNNNNNNFSEFESEISLPFPKLSINLNKTLIGLIYGILSILISTQGILFAKSGIELLVLTIFEGKNQFNQPLAWIIVSLLVITALLQLYYLNLALTYCDIILLTPINLCIYNISCLFNGLIYYNQWDQLPLWKFGMVLLGTLLICIGVGLLSLRPKINLIELDFKDNINENNEINEINLNEEQQFMDNEFAILTGGDITPPIINNDNNLKLKKKTSLLNIGLPLNPLLNLSNNNNNNNNNNDNSNESDEVDELSPLLNLDGLKVDYSKDT